jgi:4-diphosphocytidyl-2-C-methyl-D-erythritol kinase
MSLEKKSPCKVNLILNILGRRADGFHELETVMHPVPVFDTLRFEAAGRAVSLSCNEASLPTDSRNLVHRAATAFLKAAALDRGVKIRLEKSIPLAAGLGGGSGNAATALLGLNELFGAPLDARTLHSLAAGLGSDVPFFLQAQPALATGRGEQVESLHSFPALAGCWFVLVHPGFGIATAWAYQHLARFPTALNGQAGRAQRLVKALSTSTLQAAAGDFYNSLEAPALDKYPVLSLYQEFFRANGAAISLMSGSGSTTFAIVPNQSAAENVLELFRSRFGTNCWLAAVPVPQP